MASDADAEKKLGGFENEVSPNGDGTARLIKSRVPWGIDGLEVEIKDDRADLEFLQEIADGLDFVAITMTHASGVTYEGAGIVVDEIQASSQNATAKIKLEGPGSLVAQ